VFDGPVQFHHWDVLEERVREGLGQGEPGAGEVVWRNGGQGQQRGETDINGRWIERYVGEHLLSTTWVVCVHL